MKFETNKTYFLPGAMGTEIQRRGHTTALPLWSAKVLFDAPEIVGDIHRDYIRAGANILTTNTFRTQRRTLALAGLDGETERINKLAVDLAVQARDAEKVSRPVYIAACITTLEDCYRVDLVPEQDVCEREHAEQVALFVETPIDFFALETFNTIREAEAAAQAVTNKGKQFMVSFVPDEDGNILSGESWADAVACMQKYSPLAMLVNCAPPETVTRALEKLALVAKENGIPFGAYANGEGAAGSAEGWDFSKQGSPIESYAEHTRAWKALGATVIGGCCGTTPEYTEQYSRI